MEERTDEYQRRELMRLLPRVRRCAVSAHRVPVQTGHFADLKIQTRDRVPDKAAALDALRGFAPLRALALPSLPSGRPIVVVDEPGRPRPTVDADYEGGMAVAVGNVRVGDGGDAAGAAAEGGARGDGQMFDLSLSLVVNNVARGAYGAALLNAELFDLHLRPILEAADSKAA